MRATNAYGRGREASKPSSEYGSLLVDSVKGYTLGNYTVFVAFKTSLYYVHCNGTFYHKQFKAKVQTLITNLQS